MSLLVESIKVKDGRLYNMAYHTGRFDATRRELFDLAPGESLEKRIIVPAFAGTGLFKCRIEYDEHIRKIEFIPYQVKEINSLRMVEAGDLRYDFKFIDRDGIEKLLEQRSGCDDILIVKDGYISDTSYANVILKGEDKKWYTPTTPLLRGTRRQYLLDRGDIFEADITPASIRRYSELRLINAMVGINDSPPIDIEKICF